MKEVKTEFTELVKIVLDKNHSIDFQISLDIFGYAVLLGNENLSCFGLSVSKKLDFERSKTFKPHGCSMVEMTAENIEAAKEWLKNLHEEMMAKEKK